MIPRGWSYLAWITAGLYADVAYACAFLTWTLLSCKKRRMKHTVIPTPSHLTRPAISGRLARVQRRGPNLGGQPVGGGRRRRQRRRRSGSGGRRRSRRGRAVRRRLL